MGELCGKESKREAGERESWERVRGKSRQRQRERERGEQSDREGEERIFFLVISSERPRDRWGRKIDDCVPLSEGHSKYS